MGNITNVKIEHFSDPITFKLLGIPKPLKADVVVDGLGRKRIAYFDNGKRFVQEISVWEPLKQYSFNFNPEKGFTVGYFFDLADGIFQVPNGAYQLVAQKEITTLHLSTTYILDNRFFFLFNIPVRMILKAFQKYLLRAVKKDSE